MNSFGFDCFMLGYFVGVIISWGLTFFMFVLPLRNKN